MRESYDRFVAKDRLSAEDAAAALARITTTTDLEAFGDVDLVVEAVFESIEVKHEVFRALDAVCASEARPGDQHLRHPRHGDRRGHRPPGAGGRHALLLTRCR